MAGRMIKVTSAHVSQDPAKNKDYAQRRTLDKKIKYWKRLAQKREEPKYRHDFGNFWTSQTAFYCFFSLMGNGFDTMPQTMRFALNISGGVFTMFHIVFSLILTFPLLYTEMFLGKYSQLSSSQMFRMVPIAFGVCVFTLIQGVIYVSVNSPSIAMGLMGALNHLLQSTWECPPKDPICYDYKVEGRLNPNCTRMHLLLNCGKTKRLVVSMYHMWSKFLSRHDFQANWYLIIVTISTWVCIGVIVNFRMKLLELLLKVCFVINICLHTALFILALTSGDIAKALRNLVEYKFSAIKPSTIILSAFFVPVKHNVLYGGGYMTYAATMNYASHFGLTAECLLLLFSNFVLTIFYMVVFQSVTGVLAQEVGISIDGMYYAMVTEYLRLMNCPHIFISIYHLVNWLLECTKLSFIIRMNLIELYDFFPTLVEFKFHTRVAWISVCLFIGLVSTMGICVQLVNPLMWMTNLYILNSFQIFIKSLLIFYGYGISRLIDDIKFHTGQSPIKFWIIVWYFYPFMFILMIIVIIVDGFRNEKQVDFFANDFQDRNVMQSFWTLVIGLTAAVTVLIFIISFLYIIFQMRQSKRVTLLSPLYYWGPPNREERMKRKEFTPRVSIRSQMPKKKKQRFREHSVRQQHERDFAEKVSRGRLFLDKEFFDNLNFKKLQSEETVLLSTKERPFIFKT